MELASIVFILRAVALLLLPLAFLLLKFRKDPKIFEHLTKFKGPAAYPIIGSAHNLIGLSSIEIFDRICYTDIKKFGRLFRVWVLNSPQVVIGSAKYAEKILQGMAHHAKSQNYKILDSWMGKGLLTANDGMWKIHRKILTPAFHFNILHEFLPIFNKCSKELVEKLEEPAQRGQTIDIFDYVTLCALDIICESSMGASINAQQQKDSAYVKAIRELNDLLVKRYFTPHLRVDWIYNLSWHKWKTERTIKIANNFTDKIIEDRRRYLKEVKEEKNEQIDEFTEKRRPLAFIDLLLAAQDEGEQHMSNKDIRDQVSTFMFEGHDTVTTATCWALFIIGTYPEIQAKVVEELHHVFGNSGRAPTTSDLNELKYLERCLKETLRLFPSVPFFGRHLREDQPFEGGVTAPGGVTASFNVFVIHRDPEQFPNPEKFDPDRFLPENSIGRHPYAYLPFSAGPRNCIGQKFAMMEEKIVVSTVLRHFVVEAAHSIEEAQMKVGLVLKPENGLKIKLRRRSGADEDLAISS
ncbi:cytochrome P450 4C1-like [Cloeon dipterum]|uniref:cytochrome P450 4C1-like n=1 Tax=Cloeon dipterum TaxID=197152 RepID=UPI00321F6D17